VPDLEPDPLDEHGAPRATAGGLSEDRCQRRSARFGIREEVDDIREEVDDRSQVEGELEHPNLSGGDEQNPRRASRRLGCA